MDITKNAVKNKRFLIESGLKLVSLAATLTQTVQKDQLRKRMLLLNSGYMGTSRSSLSVHETIHDELHDDAGRRNEKELRGEFEQFRTLVLTTTLIICFSRITIKRCRRP